MYPRNSATPPRIAIGPVVQISDGAVQSTGVSVAVRAEGGSETAGGGTISYGASSSVVYYTPTQAETNYTAFAVIAYKTGCIPASVTIVTSAEAASGTVQVGSLATDSVDADALATDAITEIQNGLSTFDPSTDTVANVTTVDITTTNSDMRGTDLAFLASSAPANFSSLLINASGHVSQVTLVDTTTTNLDMRGTDGAATSGQATTISSQISGLNDLSSSDISAAVWQVSLATYGAVAGSTGKAFKQLKEGVISTDGSVDDASPTASSFVTTLTGPDENFYADKILVFTSGDLAGQGRIISTYDESTQRVTFDEPFTRSPVDTDEFELLAIHQHTLTQINDQVVDVVNVDTLVAGQTVAEALRRIGAITSGKVSGAGSGSEVFMDYAESVKTVTVTVDTDGNRTNVIYS